MAKRRQAPRGIPTTMRAAVVNKPGGPGVLKMTRAIDAKGHVFGKVVLRIR
jgi:hypothetical protein